MAAEIKPVVLSTSSTTSTAPEGTDQSESWLLSTKSFLLRLVCNFSCWTWCQCEKLQVIHFLFRFSIWVKRTEVTSWPCDIPHHVNKPAVRWKRWSFLAIFKSPGFFFFVYFLRNHYWENINKFLSDLSCFCC